MITSVTRTTSEIYICLQINPIAKINQPKQKAASTSPKKTYPNPISESGYKINPIVLETQRQMENGSERKERGESFMVDTNPLGLNYLGGEKPNGPTKRTIEDRSEAGNILENRKETDRNHRNQDEGRKTSRNESSNVLVVSQPSTSGYIRRKPQEAGRGNMIQNAELHEVHNASDLRARLRRTGQIEEGSGLHRVEIARQHSQRIIDVQ